MSPESMSKQVETMTKTMIQYSTLALIFFSIAWFCLTVGVFTINPVGPDRDLFSLCRSPVCSDQYLVLCTLCADFKKNKRGKPVTDLSARLTTAQN